MDLLSLTGNEVSLDISSQNYLIYSQPKAGKTTLAYNLFGERALLLGFEQGYHMIKGIHAVPVRSYQELQKIIRQLKQEGVKAKYDVVVFDTVDLFHVLCEKYLCSQHGVTEIGQVGSMGAGYAKLDNIIHDIILQIQGLGYKLFFISHANPRKVAINTQQGEIEVEKMFPTVAKRTYQIVSKFADNIFYISMEMDADNGVVRRLYTRDNKISFGGTRMEFLPNILPLDPQVIKDEIKKALEKAGGDINIENVIDYTTTKIDFDTIKAELVNLVKTVFMKNNKMNIVKEITEKHLGLGATVSNAEPYQVESLAIILDELKELI